MKGRIFKDASGLLEVLDKGMKPEQGFQACPFPDFTVWQSVFTKGTPSVSDLSRFCFSSHERRASGHPHPDLCRLRPCHCSPLSPQFCPHILDIPCVLTPALAEVPALTAFVPPPAAHVAFSLALWRSVPSEAWTDFRPSEGCSSSPRCACSSRRSQEARMSPKAVQRWPRAQPAASSLRSFT